MEPTPEQVAAGHAFYTPRMLALYDLGILGWFSRAAWRCPARRILQHYDAHVSPNHLDVGVGTGWFLERCAFGTHAPRLALMDLNTSCLDVAAKRLARYAPERYEADVLQPIELDVAPFDSVGMNYLLHCIPGDLAAKGKAFTHLGALTNPGAAVFGATLLHGGVRRNWLAREVMRQNNKKGIFSNAGDDLDGLRAVVAEHLDDPQVEVVGCVGIFSGRTR